MPTTTTTTTTTPAAFLRAHASGEVYDALLHHLSTCTLRAFEHWFHAQQPSTSVRTLAQLQKLLNEFTRQLQPAFRLSGEQKIALRHIGASSADLMEIEQQPQLAGQSIETILQFYSTFKRQ